MVPQCSGYVSFMFSEKKAWMKRERPGLFSDALADSRKQHTVNNDIANRIHPILPVLRFSFICLELPSKVPQDRITLRYESSFIPGTPRSYSGYHHRLYQHLPMKDEELGPGRGIGSRSNAG